MLHCFTWSFSSMSIKNFDFRDLSQIVFQCDPFDFQSYCPFLFNAKLYKYCFHSKMSWIEIAFSLNSNPSMKVYKPNYWLKRFRLLIVIHLCFRWFIWIRRWRTRTVTSQIWWSDCLPLNFQTFISSPVFLYIKLYTTQRV